MSLIISVIALFLAPLLSALPEEPMWSELFSALLITASLINLLKPKSQQDGSYSTVAMLAVAGLATTSLLFHWLIENRASTTNLDVMLRSTVFWITVGASFLLASTDKSSTGIYVRLIAITAGSSVAAGIGLQDYLFHLRGHQAQWREFGTSTPDFFAGHLVMTVPIAFALFLGAKGGKEKIFWLPYLLAVLLQIAVIPTTGSRFALISLAIGLTLSLSLLYAGIRHGLSFPRDSKSRLIALALVAVLGAAVVAKPILFRLQGATLKAQAHSGEFRTWTWRGTARMIASEPVLGAGPGMYVYAYPHHAVVGFTRHAHSAYLQTAADLGVPALLLILASIGMITYRGISSVIKVTVEPDAPLITDKKKGKAPPAPKEPSNELLGQLTLIDDRYLTIGLLGAITAASAQNLIDSDWFTFASGITLFTMVGLLWALVSPKQMRPIVPWMRSAAVGLCGIAGISAMIFLAAEFKEQNGSYVDAISLDPLNASYRTAIAKFVYLPQGDVDDATKAIQMACQLAPDGPSFHTLGYLYLSSGKSDLALETYKSGLTFEPNSIPLLIGIAQLEQSAGASEVALGYYHRIATLELSPYGTVRAIPEVSETGFADADGAIADSLLADRQPSQAIEYYERAASDCKDYFTVNGYVMRTQMGQSKADLDSLSAHMSDLYTNVIDNMATAYDEEGNAAAARSLKEQLPSQLSSFQMVINKGS